MARKNFHNVRVAGKIYDALELIRKRESESSYKDVAMNSFIEMLLWDYAQGKLSRKEATQPPFFGADGLTDEDRHGLEEMEKSRQQFLADEERVLRKNKKSA